MEETRRHRRPVRVVFGLIATLAGGLILGLTQLPAGNSLGIAPVEEADRPLLLQIAGILLLAAVWSLATFRSPEGGRRRSRRREPEAPFRYDDDAEDGLELPAYANVAPPAYAPVAAEAPQPPMPAPSRAVTAPPAPAAPAAPADPAPPAPAASAAATSPELTFRRPPKVQPVLHRLRGDGWYVADSVQLSRIDIDHVAVGPAGVLAVQVMSTDGPDASGLPLSRARVAAEQFQRLLLTKELDIEVVPAMLVWGPNLERVPGGVAVIDAVAVLSGKQADEWMGELAGKELLERSKVMAVRDVLADIVLGGMSDAAANPPQAVAH